MAQHIAEGLVRSGHQVTVITSFPSKMKGDIFPGFRRTMANTIIDPRGYHLCRVFTFFQKSPRYSADYWRISHLQSHQTLRQSFLAHLIWFT